jgi:hypothetical protein
MFATSHDDIRTEQWWRDYVAELESGADHHVTVFFRSLTPHSGSHDGRARLVERLESAVQTDVLNGYDARILGGEICLCGTCQSLQPARDVLETARELSGWRNAGLTSAGFTEREVDCSFTGEEYRVLAPPETTVGVYLDGTLSGVFPCAAGDSYYSVQSYLHALPDEPAWEEGSRIRQRVR